jgi:hypothetical protein
LTRSGSMVLKVCNPDSCALAIRLIPGQSYTKGSLFPHPLPPPFAPVPARTAPAPAPQAARSEWYEAKPPDVPRSACPTVSWAVSTQGIALFSGHSREILDSPQCLPLTRGTTRQPKPPLGSGAGHHGVPPPPCPALGQDANGPCRALGPRPAGAAGDALL